MYNRLKGFFSPALILLLLLCSCGRTSETEAVFLPEPSVSSGDSTLNWLESDDHFYTPGYYAVFQHYYNTQLTEKDYVRAAEALHVVANREMHYQLFDTAFAAEIDTFGGRYGSRLPWDRVQFIQSHNGYRLMEQGEFRKAIACFQKATQYPPISYNTCLETANLYDEMGFCYSSIGDQERALRCNYKALMYFSRINSEGGKGNAYYNIALVHLFTKNYSEAEDYFDRAMTAFRHEGDTTNMLNTLHNRILLYEETNDPRRYEVIDSAYRFFTASRLENPSLEVSLSSMYVEKLLDEGNIRKAKNVLDGMEPKVRQQHSTSVNDDYYIALAEYELKSGTGILDTSLIGKALTAAEEDEHFQTQLMFCGVLKENALLRHDFQKALIYSEKEKAAMTNLADRESIAKTMELNRRHQLEKKEHRIVLQARKIQHKNTYIALLVTALVAFGLMVVIFYTRGQQKKIVAERERTVQYTHRLLEKTEEERKRIAGDLHDSVSHELLSLKNALPGDEHATGTRIDAIINDIRIISRNLHPIMFEKVGLAASIEQLVERSQAVHDLMVTAEIDYNGFLPVSDELQLYRIIQETLSNTIKYARAIAAKITIRTDANGLFVEVKDNGKGFDVGEKLAGPNAFGLHNILERSKAIGGTARIYSDRNGTVVTIEIKKHA